MELTSQLKRDYMALSHIPSIVTVLAADGRVLHQNGGRAAAAQSRRLAQRSGSPVAVLIYARLPCT